MPLFMMRNDISKMQADAIVNPANKYLLEGSGTSYAIYQEAGEELLRNACGKIGYCDVGKAVVTEAFGLRAKYIIHAVGPEWDDGYSNEEQTLYDTYKNSLLLAEEKDCKTIAFPLLSSGNLGFPKDKAMKVAMSAISDFLMEHDMTVYLVLYDWDSVSVSEKLLGTIEKYIDDHYVKENNEILEGEEHFAQAVRARLERRRSERPYLPQMSSFMKLNESVENDYEDEDAESECDEEQGQIAELSQVLSGRSLDSLLDNLGETFSQMLLRLIDERGLKDSTVYKKAYVDRRHFSKIRNNVDYVPTKKTVIAFAIALELTLDEAVDLLARAGYAFSNSSIFDVIICFFLENQIYDMFEINGALFENGQTLFGE